MEWFDMIICFARSQVRCYINAHSLNTAFKCVLIPIILHIKLSKNAENESLLYFIITIYPLLKSDGASPFLVVLPNTELFNK